MVIVTAVTFLAAVTGCGKSSSVVAEASGSRTYRHDGMNFSVAAPSGWAVSPLPGDLVVELGAETRSERGRAVAHVFSRREARPVALGDAEGGVTSELLALMRQELRFGLGEEPPPEVVAVELGDLPPGGRAVGLRRVIYQGPTAVSQEVIVVTRGKQVWALMLSVPVADQEAHRGALEEIRRSFRVW
jgi:hypothetical protein